MCIFSHFNFFTWNAPLNGMTKNWQIVKSRNILFRPHKRYIKTNTDREIKTQIRTKREKINNIKGLSVPALPVWIIYICTIKKKNPARGSFWVSHLWLSLNMYNCVYIIYICACQPNYISYSLCFRYLPFALSLSLYLHRSIFYMLKTFFHAHLEKWSAIVCMTLTWVERHLI